jgi:hypothetical protein
LGEAEAPPRSRSSLSSEVEVEVESEPLGRARRRPSAEAEVESEPWVGRGGVRRLPGPRPSPRSGEVEFVIFRGRGRVRALGSGEAEFVVFRGRGRVRALGRARRSSSSSRAEAESEPWVGRGGVCCLPGPSQSPIPGSGEAEFLMAPEAGLGRCQPHSVEWHSSWSDAGGAVFLSDWSVERRSECGHFGSVD